MSSSWWDVLPVEVRDLVLRHRAAMVVQRIWLRWSVTAHTRHPAWLRVLQHTFPYYRQLAPYAMVRREWRTECESWLHTTETTFAFIAREVEEGLWGGRVRAR